VLHVTKPSLAERLIIKVMKAPVGDFRDWEAVTSWAVADAPKRKVS